MGFGPEAEGLPSDPLYLRLLRQFVRFFALLLAVFTYSGLAHHLIGTAAFPAHTRRFLRRVENMP